MPIYDANAELRPWAAATDNLSRAMLQLPALRAQLSRQREQDAMEAQVNQARIASLNAGTDYDRARTAGETQDQGGDMQISKALRLLQVNPNDTNAAADLMEGVGKSFRHNPKQTSEAVGMLMSAILARQGSTNYAQQGALQGDAASIANNLANVGARKEIAADTMKNRETLANINAASREKIARTTRRVVSRDSGLWNPETQSWDVPKPDRPAGNANNLYDPATRQALTTLGEELAKSYATGNTTNITKLESQIEAVKARANGGAGKSEIPQRPMRSNDSQPASPAATTVQSLDAELKLAQDAIRQGANRAKVAAKFKARTGQDLPQ